MASPVLLLHDCAWSCSVARWSGTCLYCGGCIRFRGSSGAFLFEHILISNSTAISGPEAYAPSQLSGESAARVLLELFGIWLPILFHALYRFYIWYRGDGNTIAYPWSGNWMYTAALTGGIAFVTSYGTPTPCDLPLICTIIRWRRLPRCG